MRQFNIPPGLVTGVGSLPFHQPDEAVAWVAKLSPQMPFWPQLPHRSPSEMMIPQTLGRAATAWAAHPRGWGYVLPADQVRVAQTNLLEANPALLPDNAAGFFAFEAACKAGQFPQALALKGQVTGPLTLASQLFIQSAPKSAPAQPLNTLPPAELGPWLQVLAQRVISVAGWQAARLKSIGLPVWIWLDEPALGALNRTPSDALRIEALKYTINQLQKANILVGLHCCAPLDLAVLTQCQPNLLSFDAHANLEQIFSHPAGLTYLSRGGLIAWGLVPTTADLNLLTAAQLSNRLLNQLLSGPISARLAWQKSLITASCGLGYVSPSQVRRNFELAHSISTHINEALTLF